MSNPARAPWAAVLTIITTATLAVACSSSGGSGSVQNRHLTKATGLPPASAVTPDNTAVPAGRWGVVQGPDYLQRPTTFAIRATASVRGKAGALRNVQVDAGGGPSLRTAVPYYVSYEYSVLAGSPQSSPIQQLSGVSGATPDAHLSTLEVPDDLERCTPRGDYDPVPPGLGYAERGCVVVVADAGAVPRFLQFDRQQGSTGVRFAIPQS